jgi:hypothetical protein
MVTPTFATGLGVVVAAALAYQMGTPAFKVAAPRWDGHQCSALGCQAGSAPASPASVRGSHRMPSPRPAATGGTHSPGPGPAPSPAGTTRTGTHGGARPGQPTVSYRTEASWPGGFEGSITVSFAAGHAPRRWWLRFSYPAGLIQRVWGPATWHPVGEHMAVVEFAAGGAGRDGQNVQVWFQVAGSPGRPQQCHLNGVTCRVG